MFRHSADAIKESSRKRFLSQAEKDKFHEYDNIFINKTDTYTKSEIYNLSKEFTEYTEVIEDSYITVDNTKDGEINKIEIFGNSINPIEVETLCNPAMVPGSIIDNGEEALINYISSEDFIKMEKGDTVTVRSYIGDSSAYLLLDAYVAEYNKDKEMVYASSTISGEYTVKSNDCRFIKITVDSTVNVYQLQFQLRRKVLDKIVSVGKIQPSGDYKITLKSCNRNLFDGKISIGHYTPYGLFANNDRGNVCISDNFIPINPKKYYSMSPLSDLVNRRRLKIFDNNYTNMPGDFVVHQNKPVILRNETRYIKPQCNKIDSSDLTDSEINFISKNLMVSHSDDSEFDVMDIPYEEHRYSESEIILPCKLEKVGNVSDRLFRREDGVWCVEKNIKTQILTGTSNMWITETSIVEPPYIKFVAYGFEDAARNECVAEGYEYIGDGDGNLKLIRINSNPNIGRLAMITDQYRDIDDFKSSLNANPIRVLYVTKTPEIIELSAETQVKLNTFNGETNIFLHDSEVQASKISVEIPKSMKSSMNTMINEIDVIENNLKKVENTYETIKTTYSTTTGDCHMTNTSDGIISDVYMEGDTKVNIYHPMTTHEGMQGTFEKNITMLRLTREATHINKTYIKCILGSNVILKPNTYYTVFLRDYSINDQTRTGHVSLLDRKNYLWLSNVHSVTIGNKPNTRVVLLKTIDDIPKDAEVELLLYTLNDDVGAFVEVSKNIVILEGDYSKTNMSYFDGMCSVGSVMSNSKTFKTVESEITVNRNAGDSQIIEIARHMNEHDSIIRLGSITMSVSTNNIIRAYLENTITKKQYTVFENGTILRYINVPKGDYIIKMEVKDSATSFTISAFTIYSRYINGIQMLTKGRDAVNLFDRTKVIDNEKIVASDGTTAADARFARYDGMISVKDSDIVTIRNKHIKVKHTAIHVSCYTSDKSFIDSIGDSGNATIALPPGTAFITFYCNKNINSTLRTTNDISYEAFLDTEVYINSTEFKHITYLDANSDSQPVILRSLDTVKDTIEKHADGKYYYHKRCTELDLSNLARFATVTRLSLSDDNTHNKSIFQYKLDNYNIKTDYLGAKYKCNFFGVDNVQNFNWTETSKDVDKEGIAWRVSGNRWIAVIVDRSRLEEDTVNGFVKWLTNMFSSKEFSVKLTCELEQEEVYECTNMDMNSYENETDLYTITGPVAPKLLTVTQTGYLGNIVNNLAERMNNIEQNYLNRKIIHNKLMLNTIYTSDRTDLSVDILTRRTRTRSNDNDIYNLLYMNIIEGPTNYNRCDMEEKIDFYTMIEYISYEQADMLFELIENQHEMTI